MTIVGLIGAKRAGKDSVAGVLVEQLGYRRFAFADALKAVALDAHDGLGALVSSVGWEAAKDDGEVRTFLQKLGVAVREHVDEDVWVNVVELGLVRYGGYDAVITDVRFPNEVAMIRRRGGYIVRVDRPGIDESDAHVSEQLYRTVTPDVAIENSGTLEALAHRTVSVAVALEERDYYAIPPSIPGLESHGIGGKWARGAR